MRPYRASSQGIERKAFRFSEVTNDDCKKRYRHIDEDPDFQERLGKLSKVLKDRLTERGDSVLVPFDEVITEFRLQPGGPLMPSTLS